MEKAVHDDDDYQLVLCLLTFPVEADMLCTIDRETAILSPRIGRSEILAHHATSQPTILVFLKSP